MLLAVGPFRLYSFGLLVFLGYFFGLFVIWKRAREEHFFDEHVFDVVLSVSLAAILVARVVYILLHGERFGFSPLTWVNILGEPGLSLPGLFLGLGAGLWSAVNSRKWDFFEFADIFVVGVALAMAIGWVGAFLNGTTLGIPTALPWGVTFAGLYDKRHPVQLYAGLGYAFLFWFLWWVEAKYRTFEWYRVGKSSARNGFLTFAFLVFSGLLGMMTTALSVAEVTVGGIRPEALFWLGVFILGVGGVYWRSGRRATEDFEFLKKWFPKGFSSRK